MTRNLAEQSRATEERRQVTLMCFPRSLKFPVRHGRLFKMRSQNIWNISMCRLVRRNDSIIMFHDSGIYRNNFVWQDEQRQLLWLSIEDYSRQCKRSRTSSVGMKQTWWQLLGIWWVILNKSICHWTGGWKCYPSFMSYNVSRSLSPRRWSLFARALNFTRMAHASMLSFPLCSLTKP